MNINEALRDAKLAYLTSIDPLQARPANWATFVTIGNIEPLHLSGFKWWWGVIGMLLLLSLWALFWKIKR